MRKWILGILALAAPALAAASAPASAQSVGIYVGPSAGYYDPYYGPRVYGYTRRAPVYGYYDYDRPRIYGERYYYQPYRPYRAYRNSSGEVAREVFGSQNTVTPW
jgi:hypothetical protein